MHSKSIETVSHITPGIIKDEKRLSHPVKEGETGVWRRRCRKTGQPLMRKEFTDAVTPSWDNENVVCPRAGWRGLNAAKSGHSRIMQGTSLEVVPRTISPTFGATSFVTFDARHDTTNSRACIMLSTVIWPSAVDKAISKHWFEDFCTSPLLYHAHCVAAASCRDCLAGGFLWSGSKFSSVHRTGGFSHIREQLTRFESMSSQDIEKLIFAMMILSEHELEPSVLNGLDLPFIPHVRAANMLCLSGRVEAHRDAAFALIRSQGGLDKLQYPGLGAMAAFVDILRAGSYMHKPALPCYWSAHVVDVLPESIDVEEFLTSARRPGIGFFKLPGGVPHSASSVFAEVACLDRVMSTFQERTPSDHDLMTLLDARRATLHRLYSLPVWDELTQEEQGRSHGAIYEVCRITAIIYCNAVLLPIPIHNGWHHRHTARLVEVLITANFEMWDIEVSELHVWALLIGGMATQGTAQRSFLEDSLKRWYAAHRHSWAAITTSLKEFIWSDRACKVAGATLLHHALFGSNA